jgi:hypothetical protein
MGRREMMRTTMIAAACAAIGTAGGIAGVSAAGQAPPTDRNFDPSMGGHVGPNGTETLLTGDVATKVRQAALDKVGGGTVERVETDADHGSPYEAHIRRSDGTELEVLVNKDFSVTAVNEMGQPPR